MLTPEESAELRSLQARAYGPGGGVPDRDAARLRELEARRVAPAAVVPPEPAVPEAIADVPGLAELLELTPRPEAAVQASEVAAAIEEASSAEPARGLRALLRRRWVPYAAAVLAVLLGVGIGWLAFGDRAQLIALQPAQVAHQAELNADERFDAGSVTVVGQEDDATLWRATADDGDRQCIILAFDEQDSVACVPMEEFELTGVNTGLADGGDQLSAALLHAVDGRVTGFIQRYTMDQTWDWRSQYSEGELAIVDRLEDEGYDGQMLSLIGYDRETPVWTSWTEDGMCVIVTTPERTDRACTPDPADTVSLEVPAQNGTTTTYVVQQSEYRVPILTIERYGDAASFDDTTGEQGAEP